MPTVSRNHSSNRFLNSTFRIFNLPFSRLTSYGFSSFAFSNETRIVQAYRFSIRVCFSCQIVVRVAYDATSKVERAETDTRRWFPTHPNRCFLTDGIRTVDVLWQRSVIKVKPENLHTSKGNLAVKLARLVFQKKKAEDGKEIRCNFWEKGEKSISLGEEYKWRIDRTTNETVSLHETRFKLFASKRYSWPLTGWIRAK